MFIQDFVVDGQAYGPVGMALAQNRWDPGFRRPYFDKHGNPAVTINRGRFTYEKGERKAIKEHVLIRDLVTNGVMSPVFNATTLRKEEWLELDRVVLRAARYRLRAWQDLVEANSFGGFNAMGKLILEHETMTDPGEAIIDMDGLTEGRSDTLKFQLQGTPLPITHVDFFIDARKLAASRNTGTPIDTQMGEAGGRRIGESLEKQAIGNNTGVLYGGNSTQVGGYGRNSQIYGYTTFPPRLIKNNIVAPTAGGWTASKTLADTLACLDLLRANKFYGPFVIYHSNDWDQYMDNDYILTGGNVATQTLRNRLRAIDGITDVKRLDFLFSKQPVTDVSSSSYIGPGGEGIASAANPFTLLFVQMTADVARAINGMDITTLQWESVGGMRLNFKVMCIQVPQLRADFYGNCGILQATTS